MAIIADYQIYEFCKTGMIEPFDENMVNPSSLDIRIGKTAMTEITGRDRVPKSGIVYKEYSDFHLHSKENPYWMEPNETILVSTLEKINLPIFLSAEVKLKSSRAREGLSHALAGYIDNGYEGIITLELKNYLRENEVAIYPGLRIGQLIFQRTVPPHKPYNGKYQQAESVLASKDTER